MIAYLIKDGSDFYVQRASGFKPKNAITVVPDSFSKSDYPYLKGVEVDVDGSLVWQVILDDSQKSSDEDKKNKEKQKDDLKKNHTSVIDAEKQLVFDTTEESKTFLLLLTWQEMVKDPSYFSNKGLFDDKDKALDTAAKVLSYAESKLGLAKDYVALVIDEDKKLKDNLAALG